MTIVNRQQASEVRHGRRIATHAEDVWGWSTLAGRQRAERRAALLLQCSGIAPGQRVLEIGGGTGLFTERLARCGATLFTVDVSPDLLQRARRRLQTTAHVLPVLADVVALPFPDQSMDAVVGSSILHHLPLPLSLPEIYRVLRPGGAVAFAEPNMLNPQIMIQKHVPFIKRWMGDTPDETAFVRWPLARAFRAAGFVDMVVEPYDFLHPWTPDLIVPLVRRLGCVMERLPLFKEIAGSLIIGGRRPAMPGA